MKKVTERKWMIWGLLAVWVFAVRCLGGCSTGDDESGKVRDLSFTVVGESEVPADLMATIQTKQTDPFKLTYSDDQNLYIVVGYGQQQSGGYSISVNALYLTENSVVIDTELKGPETGENGGTEKSSPYVVVKTELLENPVVFQ